MASAPRIGTAVGGYILEAEIGRGGMGIVYRARHQTLGRVAALKVLPPELASDDGFRQRFIRESRTAASLDHPNIVPIFEAGETDGLLFLAMRFVDGKDLERRLSEGPMTPSEVIVTLAQIASALDAAHKADLVHRDVKPANMLIALAATSTEPTHVYLTDFGLTKQRTSQTGLTKAGSFLGTVDYIAPEQLEGDDVDGRADQYSLACTAFRCLTGEVPFPRQKEIAVAMAHLREPPPSARSRNHGLPAPVDVVLARGMAKDREARYIDCRSFVGALEAALAGEPVSGANRRLPTRLMVGAIGVAVVSGAALWSMSSNRAPGPTPAASAGLAGSGASPDPGRPSSSAPTSASAAPTITALPVASPGANGVISFAADGRLYLVPPDGGEPSEVPVSSDDTEDAIMNPAWAPDGSELAYVRHGLASWLEVLAPDGASGRRVSSAAADPGVSFSAIEADWSPDGTRLAVTDGDSINIVLAEDGQPSATIRDRVAVGRPRWSPDGMRVAYSVLERISGSDSAAPVPSGIKVISAQPGATPLTISEEPLDSRPDWSPDGTRIVFDRVVATVAGRQLRHLFVVSSDGGVPSDLTRDLDARAAAWSPDGSRIAFVSVDDAGRGRLMAVNPDGGLVSELAADVDPEEEPVWSPDGTLLAAWSLDAQRPSTITGVVVVRADGSGPATLIEHPAEFDIGISWQWLAP